MRPTPATVLLSIVLAVYGIPVFFIVATSLRLDADVYKEPLSLLFTPTLEPYQKAFRFDVADAALASIRISLMTTALVLAVATPAAYALARSQRLGLALGLGCLFFLQLVPPSILVIPLYKVLHIWGLLGSIEGVVVALAAYLVPFAILLLRPFFLGVPIELEDAAAIDGAGRLRTFGSIVLPLAWNGVITIGILLAMIVWGDFLFAVTLLVNPKDYPLSALLVAQVTDYGLDWSRIMALAVISSAPVVAVFLLTQRRLSEGLSVGAVK